MRYRGNITSWKDDKGFGFINPAGGGDQVFVHIKSFTNRQRRPLGNERVSYELKTDAKGRAQAERVSFAGERALAGISFARRNASLILASAFLAFVAGASYTGNVPVYVLGLYVAVSAVAFITYALDKSAATSGRWRIQERTLHLFALFGGWPGALAAQTLLRHKSRKQSFQMMFWATVALNCGMLAWIFSSSGIEVLRSILGAA
jgi:uncharacterized membrane protein YsdA (DUF1294 family)/cold shock CspA family protein